MRHRQHSRVYWFLVMKRSVYILLIMMAMVVVGCHQNTKQNPVVIVKDTVNKVEKADDATPLLAEQNVGALSDCDMVMLNKGKLFFYNTKTSTLTPCDVESDSVVNCAFVDNMLYYCVPEKGKMVLKSMQLDAPSLRPVKLADWGLDYEKCVTETYGTVSPLLYYAGHNALGLWHEFSWDSYALSQQKLYNLDTGEITDWNWEEWDREERARLEAKAEEQTEENYTFDPVRDELKELLSEKEGNYWLVDGIEHVCLTDRIDFDKYVSDPDYATEREFEYISSSPDNLMVLYMAILEWGDYPHGVLCVSSVDGAVQMPLEDTDCSEYHAEWLDDGSLVYVGFEPLSSEKASKWDNSVPCVKRVFSNGSTKTIARCSEFQLRKQ